MDVEEGAAHSVHTARDTEARSAQKVAEADSARGYDTAEKPLRRTSPRPAPPQ